MLILGLKTTINTDMELLNNCLRMAVLPVNKYWEKQKTN